MYKGKRGRTVSISGKAGDRVIVAKGTGCFGVVHKMRPKAVAVSNMTAQKALRYGVVRCHKKAPHPQFVGSVKLGRDIAILTETTAHKAKMAQKAQITQYLHQEQADVDNALATLKRLRKNNDVVWVRVK